MANISQKHKEKRSQKRKDRQLHRAQKKQMKELKESSAQRDDFMIHASNSMKGTTKSLPGFLAKHSNTICRWLNDYCVLFQKADDAYIDYLKFMDRERRNSLVQDYVDIRVFLEAVKQLKNKSVETKENEVRNDEIVQQNMG